MIHILYILFYTYFVIFTLDIKETATALNLSLLKLVAIEAGDNCSRGENILIFRNYQVNNIFIT